MKKVAFRTFEYNAGLPPYRFDPGDVVEIDDDWADQLVRRGIAAPAKKNAKTVQQIRIASRPPVPTAADERAVRRASLQAELDALDQQDAGMVTQDDEDDDGDDDGEGASTSTKPPTPPEGHYGDMVTRGQTADAPVDPVTSGAHSKTPAGKR